MHAKYSESNKRSNNNDASQWKVKSYDWLFGSKKNNVALIAYLIKALPSMYFALKEI